MGVGIHPVLAIAGKFPLRQTSARHLLVYLVLCLIDPTINT